MDRLTEKTIGCFKYDLKNFDHKVGEFGTYDAFFAYSTAVKKLGEYEDAEEQREQQPKTNADRIRAMTDEELSLFLWSFNAEDYSLEETCGDVGICTHRKLEDWLKQPVEDEEIIEDCEACKISWD